MLCNSTSRKEKSMSSSSTWAIAKVAANVLLTLLLGAPMAEVFGQNRNAGEIRGTVKDSSGAVVPEVTVTMTNRETGVSTRVMTGATGVYAVPSLLPGEYVITFSKQGFKQYVRSGVVLHIEVITVDAVMEVGALSQEVTISGAAPLVQTESSERKELITSKMVTELPNVNRQWFYLTGLLPGGNPGTQGQEIGGPSSGGGNVGLNGTASYESNWLVDGGAGTIPASQNTDLLVVPLEAIAEVDLSTSNFSAEYGNGLSVFNVITKSGTNQWHGSLFEFVQNDKLEARNFFAPTITPLRWNEYGGSVGGPIKRDKAFFFFSYQNNPTNTVTPTFYTYPTAAMRTGDFSAPGLPTVYDPATLRLVNGNWVRSPFPGNIVPANRIDPVARNIQAYLPLPNLPGVFNNYYFPTASPLTTKYYNGKVDYDLSSGNRMTGSLMLVRQNGAQGGLVPACQIQCTDVHTHEMTAQLTDVWTIRPTLVNEFRSSAARESDNFAPRDEGKGYPSQIGLNNPAEDAFPLITIEGASPTSINGGIGALNGFNSFAQSDALTWVKGKHILKFGGEFDKWQVNGVWQQLSSGNFDFNGIFTRNPADPNSSGLGYADFFFGLPDTWSVNIAPITGGRVWNLQFFAQDDYKITPKLTLNVGLRYEIQPGWTEVHNRLSDFDPSLINPATGTLGALWFAGQNGRNALERTIPDVLSPRVGFAWAPKSTWSFRGAYGIFPSMWGGNTYYSAGAAGGYRDSKPLRTPYIRSSVWPKDRHHPSIRRPLHEPQTY